MREVKLGSLDIKFIDGDRGKNYPKQEDLLEKGYCLFLSAKNITSDGFQLNDLVFITEEKDNLLRKGKLEANDIIITTRGTIGNVCIYNNKIPFKNVRINSGMLIIRNESLDINTDYLYQFLKSDIFRERTRTFAFGAAVPQLPISTLVNIKINLPPLETQKKIASILSGYDDLIENNLKRIKILEEMAQQTYEEWFVRMRFPGHESATINPETGLPEGWEKAKFEKYFEINNGFAFKSDDYINEGILLLRTRDYSTTKWIDINQKVFIKENTKYNKYKSQKWDLMLIMVGASIGNYGVVLPKDENLYLNQNQWAIRSKTSLFDFFKILMMERLINDLLSKKTGAARDFFRSSFLKELDIVIPNVDLVNEMNLLIEPIYNLINSLFEQNQRLREARDILLPRLMMGMIEM